MDEPVNAARWPGLRTALLTSALAAAASAGWAQSADPTRPPAALLSPAEHGAAPAAGSVLQSIAISYGTPPRRIAIIDGQPVQVGARVGSAVVERIGEREVVLRSGRTRRVLKLYERQPVPDAVPAEADAASGRAPDGKP